MKNLKYNLTIQNCNNQKNDIIQCINMKSLIEKINEVLENEKYPVEFFKINNQVIYNLQNDRSTNKILKKLFKIEKHFKISDK